MQTAFTIPHTFTIQTIRLQYTVQQSRTTPQTQTSRTSLRQLTHSSTNGNPKSRTLTQQNQMMHNTFPTANSCKPVYPFLTLSTIHTIHATITCNVINTNINDISTPTNPLLHIATLSPEPLSTEPDHAGRFSSDQFTQTTQPDLKLSVIHKIHATITYKVTNTNINGIATPTNLLLHASRP